MTLPAPGAVRVLRYVVVDPDEPAAPDGKLAALLAAGWRSDRRVVFPASGRAEIATCIAWRDEPEGAEHASLLPTERG